MAKPPDAEELARRYVTLWQEQLLAVAADPATAEAAARWMSLFAPPAGMAPAAAMMARALWPVPGARTDESRAEGTAAPPGAAPAAGPSGAGRDDMEQLARRLAALEERLAALESGARRTGTRPRRAAARRRP